MAWGFGSNSSEPDDELARTLVDGSSSTRKKLAQAQTTLREALSPEESAILSGSRHSGGTLIVVTDRRLLEFKKAKLVGTSNHRQVRGTRVENFGGTWVVDVLGPMLPIRAGDRRSADKLKASIDLLLRHSQ